MYQVMNLQTAIAIQALFTIYYIFLIVIPLCQIEKISGKINYGYRIFILRFVLLFCGDCFNHTITTAIDTIVLFVLAFLTVPEIKKELNYIQKIDSKLARYDELSNEDLTSYGIKNRKEIEKSLFKILKNIQTARTNYDYDTLKHLCTEKLYNLYICELNVLHQADLGYHFEDYKLVESQIYSIESDDKYIKLKVAMKASCISYRLDAEKQLVDGSKTDHTIIVHELEFTKNIKTKEIEINCPNCGAPTKRSAKGKCSYCGTIIGTESSDWQLSKNKVIAEKVIKESE